jgi:putative zinc finger protein
MDCDNLRDDRLDFLYGEADPAARQRVLEHLAGCASCRDEMDGLRRLRHDLQAWKLAEGPGPAFVAPRRLTYWLPAAAGFLLALGAGFLLSGIEFRSDAAGFAVRVGQGEAGFRKALAESEARALARDEEQRREIETLKAALASAPARDEATVLARVADMVRESEARQGRQMESTLVRLDQKQAAQRRYDMARIAAGLSYLDGRSGQHVAKTTELMGYVLDAAAHQR